MAARQTIAAALGIACLFAGCKRRVEAPPGPTPGSSPPAPAAPAPAVLDATLPADYDPAAAVQDGADPAKVYLAEPRNPVWAAAVEGLIGGQLDRDVKRVVPGAGGVRMGCRTLSCLILVDVPADKMALAIALVQLVTLGPVTVNLGPTPEGRGQVLILNEPRMADPATYTGWYRRTRRKTLDSLHAGDQPNPLPIPAADLPRE
jgi:hypothetical protein